MAATTTTNRGRCTKREKRRNHLWPKTIDSAKCSKEKDEMYLLWPPAHSSRATPGNLRTAESEYIFRIFGALASPSKFTANLCKSFKYCLSIRRAIQLEHSALWLAAGKHCLLPRHSAVDTLVVMSLSASSVECTSLLGIHYYGFMAFCGEQ